MAANEAPSEESSSRQQRDDAQHTGCKAWHWLSAHSEEAHQKHTLRYSPRHSLKALVEAHHIKSVLNISIFHFSLPRRDPALAPDLAYLRAT